MLLGHIDLVDHRMIRGWAADTDRPFVSIEVAIFGNGRLIGIHPADQPREDLKDGTGFGSGNHGIHYTFDPPLAEDQDHEVAVRFVDGGKLVGQWQVPQVQKAAEPRQDQDPANVGDTPRPRRFVGFVDRCDSDRIAGWAACEDAPDEVVSVVILVDGQEITRVACDVPRDDLAASGLYGDGGHGFEYAFETPLPENSASKVDIRFAATGIAVGGSGQWITPVAKAKVPVAENAPTNGLPEAEASRSRLVGFVDRASRHELAGWAADRERPDAAVSVIVFINGERMAVVRCDVARPDIVKAGKWASEDHGFRFRFDPPLPEGVDTQIVVRFLDSAEVLINGRKDFAATRSDEPLRPVLVTAPGRSGTTMLMERLRQCGEVVVANSHPYEIRMLSYYATAYRVLTAAADLKKSTHPDRLEGDGYFVGFNPFSEEDYKGAFGVKSRHEEFFSNYIPDETLRAFRHIITEYYERNRDEQQKMHARFFAEKNNNLDLLPRQFTRAMFGTTKEIVLLRDPRDLYCSRMSYFKNVPGRTLLQEVRWACTQLREIHAAATPDMIFIRYEDMVQNNTAELARLSGFLGFELDMNNALDDTKFAVHGTSASPASSVGRWRAQLGEAEIAMFDESGGEFFEIFGYEMGKTS
jgi:hypothetical protein